MAGAIGYDARQLVRDTYYSISSSSTTINETPNSYTSSTQAYHSLKLDVYAGDKFILNSLGATPIRPYALTDQNRNVLSVCPANECSHTVISVAQDGYLYINLRTTSTNNWEEKFYLLPLNSLLKNQVKNGYELWDRLPQLKDNPIADIRFDVGMLPLIQDWGFIGDSLASGWVSYKNANQETDGTNMYPYSWGQQLCRLTGTNGYNFTNGGQTAKGWIQGGTVYDDSYIGGVGGGGWSYAKLHPKQAYIIALGINDVAHDDVYPLGDITTDIGTYDTQTDTDTNANTFAGWYAGIIQRIQSIQPRAKIFVVTLPYLSEKRHNYSMVIKGMADYFDNIYVIDLDVYATHIHNNTKFRTDYFWKPSGDGHMTEAGYLYTAWMFINYIDWIMRSNMDDFKYISFADKDIEYTPV